MLRANFDKPTLVTHSKVLRGYFGSDDLHINNGSILFSGEIFLSNGVEFFGDCVVGSGSKIGKGCVITESIFGCGNEVRPYSIIKNLKAGDRNTFGPYCFLRDDCQVDNDCIIGAHVEATRAIFKKEVKVSHRAFIGDANLEEGVIVGAGVIFCNWDGKRHQQSTILKMSLIGSGSLLIAPVTLGKNSIIAAGSTITRNVDHGEKVIQK